MALTTDGKVYTWGSYYTSLLGDGSNSHRYAPDLEHPILTDIKSIELSQSNAAAITKDGNLYIWGCNDRGQAGNGSTSSNCQVTKAAISGVSKVVLFKAWISTVTVNNDLYM